MELWWYVSSFIPRAEALATTSSSGHSDGCGDALGLRIFLDRSGLDLSALCHRRETQWRPVGDALSTLCPFFSDWLRLCGTWQDTARTGSWTSDGP